MLDNKRTYIALFGQNESEYLQIVLWGWVANLKMRFIAPEIASHLTTDVRRISFIRRYIEKSIKIHEASLGDYKGLWYEVNKQTIDLTNEFYDKQLKNRNDIIDYYNKIFKTSKFEAYVKKEISNHIFSMLNHLHTIRLSSLSEESIIIGDTPLNRFILRYMELKYKVKYRIRWISPLRGLFSLCMYYIWLFVEIVKRGMVFSRKRKTYKISMEAIWGFYRKTLRNDVVIDNKRFRPKDILMLRFFRGDEPQRVKAFKEARERGFDTAFVPKLGINITKNVFSLLAFYFFIPVRIYFQLFFKKQSYFFYYIFLFHKKCLPIEILMNLYRIKCHISIVDCDDIVTTIILNKYGTKNVIFHWSDLTFYKAYRHAFVAHNSYFVWGDIHYDYHADNYFVDEKIDIGCIYKEEYNKAFSNKEEIIRRISLSKASEKVAAFFDVSFSNDIHFTEEFFLDYLELIKEFCEKNRNINVLLKPKSAEDYETNVSRDNISRFRRIWNELANLDNFICLDPLKISIEEIIAISDVCISMGMNSPSTIALICGKDALYFDNTGNIYHPFALKYMNEIVFEDKERLFQQVDNILSRGFRCKDVISEEEIRRYDTFDDDKGLERLRESLYQSTLS